MKKYFFILIIILSFLNYIVYANNVVDFSKENGVVLTKVDSNSCYIYDSNKLDYILLAGPSDKSYFYFPCGGVIFNKKVSVNNINYYVVNLKVRTSPQESTDFIRVVKLDGQNLIDEKELSYSVNSCFSLEGGYKVFDIPYLSYLIFNKDKLNSVCDESSGEVVIGRKTNLYNFLNKKFSKKGYLIKDDKVVVSRYMSVDGEFWLYVSYDEKVKRWVKMNDIF